MNNYSPAEALGFVRNNPVRAATPKGTRIQPAIFRTVAKSENLIGPKRRWSDGSQRVARGTSTGSKMRKESRAASPTREYPSLSGAFLMGVSRVAGGLTAVAVAGSRFILTASGREK